MTISVIDPGLRVFRNKTKHSQAPLHGATGRSSQKRPAVFFCAGIHHKQNMARRRKVFALTGGVCAHNPDRRKVDSPSPRLPPASCPLPSAFRHDFLGNYTPSVPLSLCTSVPLPPSPVPPLRSPTLHPSVFLLMGKCPIVLRPYIRARRYELLPSFVISVSPCLRGE